MASVFQASRKQLLNIIAKQNEDLASLSRQLLEQEQEMQKTRHICARGHMTIKKLIEIAGPLLPARAADLMDFEMPDGWLQEKRNMS